jgi:uncharacterized protein (DUF2249 family)/quercetin dioxygenase-like cupin family protein
MSGHAATEQELDVRPLRKPEKHPAIFATYADLPVGGSFVLVNDHDPNHLREEFETEHGGSFGWEYLSRETRNWRIRITKLTSTPLPRILVSTADLAAEIGAPDVNGAVWKLQVRDRDLDSNIIAIPPDGVIDTHAGPDLDVLIHVLAGSGTLTSERGTLELEPGVLAWLPRQSMRQFSAGPAGLRYLTVHKRRQALVLEPTMRSAG